MPTSTRRAGQVVEARPRIGDPGDHRAAEQPDRAREERQRRREQEDEDDLGHDAPRQYHAGSHRREAPNR